MRTHLRFANCVGTIDEGYKDEICLIIENNDNIELNDFDVFDEEKIWKVYLHTVPKEISGYDWDKYYVGITHHPTKIRWGLSGQGYKGQFFYKAISKYGWDNIKHEILYENLIQAEACQHEIELIEKLNSCDRRYGYNASYGGNLGGLTPLRVAKYDLEGKRVILCDDIITTGWTLNECALMLINSGASQVLCITAADAS